MHFFIDNCIDCFFFRLVLNMVKLNGAVRQNNMAIISFFITRFCIRHHILNEWFLMFIFCSYIVLKKIHFCTVWSKKFSNLATRKTKILQHMFLNYYRKCDHVTNFSGSHCSPAFKLLYVLVSRSIAKVSVEEN